MAAVWIVLLGLGTLLAGCTAPRSDPPTNLIVISVDTLRADHMSLYGYGRDTTPRLASFADRAVTFELARAPWPKNPEHDVDVYGSIRVSQRYFGAFRCFSWVI